MLMKILSLSLSLLLFTSCVTTSSSSEQQTTEKNQGDQPHLFWQVKGEKSTTYILGSIHVGKKDFYPMPAIIEDSFSKSDRLVLEVKDITQGTIMSYIKDYMFLKNGTTILDLLSEKHWKILETYLQKNHLNINQFSNQQPWLLSLFLTGMEYGKQGYAEEFGVERYFSKKLSHKQTIDELENIEFQAKLFATMPLDQQVFILELTLEGLGDASTQLHGLVDAWRHGDSVRLEKVLIESMESEKFPDFYTKLLTDRNINMVEKLSEFLKEDKTNFVLVGVGHLVGQGSMIELLKKKGYKVKSLKQ